MSDTLPTDDRLSEGLQAISGRLINSGCRPLHHRHPDRVTVADLERAAGDLGHHSLSDLLRAAGL